MNDESMSAAAGGRVEPARVRQDFPILSRTVRGHPLVYLDNAATTQKPRAVIEAVSHYYEQECASVRRGVHFLSEAATAAFEGARVKVQRLLGAASPSEIVFVRGATEGINLVARSYGGPHLHAGDEVLISGMEHHANIVPWQMICEERGAHLRVLPITDTGELVIERLQQMLNERTRIVSMVHVSNALGTVNPVKEIVQAAHARGVPVLIDGAQAAGHMPVDVRSIGCDFYVMSGHKVHGPTGIGVLYGRRELLEAMPPYQAGGDMIKSVTFERTVYQDPPWRFEAGTPDIAGAIGLGAAADYVLGLGLESVQRYEQELTRHALEAIGSVPGVRIVGMPQERSAIVSFIMQGVHPHDLGTVLDQQGIAIRAGHHCAQPLMARFGLPATARASFASYNTHEEIESLIAGLHLAREVLGHE